MSFGDTDDAFGVLMGNKKFNDPFLLNSNLYIPKNFFTALEFALYLAIKNPLYTQATTRVVSHFVTDIEFTGGIGSDSEHRDLRGYLREELCLMEALQQGGTEEFVFGNSFVRIHFPFDRYLQDRRNGGYRQISVNAFDPESITYNAKNMTYNVPDPLTLHLGHKERKRVDLEFVDRKSHDPSRIRLRFIDPKRMLLNMNYVSGTTEFIWRFDEFFRSDIMSGQKIYQVNETPMEMLRAISEDKDFVFSPGSIFHFRNPFVSGISFNGWGIPNILLNYNSIHQLQVLHCINEAVGLDYMLPFRLISPAQTGGTNDASAATNLGRWSSAMQSLIEHKRKDPTALHTVPFPVTYQELGANGKALAPVELLNAQRDQVLDNMGYPAELWHSSLQYQQVPTAIRAFESTYTRLQREMNAFTKWVTKSILDYLEREQIGVRLQLPSVADNMEQRQVYLQLAAGGQLSMKTALRPFNVEDPLDEIRQRTREDIEATKIRDEEQQKYERESTLGSANQVVDAMVQAQGGSAGAAPPPPLSGGGGGAAGVPPASNSVTPLQLEQEGEQIAMQMLAIQDNGERSKALHQIEATNPTLHAVVMRHMEKMRSQGASEGRKSVGQQLAQQQA